MCRNGDAEGDAKALLLLAEHWSRSVVRVFGYWLIFAAGLHFVLGLADFAYVEARLHTRPSPQDPGKTELGLRRRDSTELHSRTWQTRIVSSSADLRRVPEQHGGDDAHRLRRQHREVLPLRPALSASQRLSPRVLDVHSVGVPACSLVSAISALPLLP